MKDPCIAVVCGGTSTEREVSLGSGKTVAEGLNELFPVETFIVDEEEIPSGIDRGRHVVFSTLHGTFGEDGGFQGLLDGAGIGYAGCDRESSALTFDKARTKTVLAKENVPVADQILFSRNSVPDIDAVARRLGTKVVLKPVCEGSSVGLKFAESKKELEAALEELPFEHWMLEPMLEGREFSVGVIEGAVLGIVEISPKSGRFDYESKYTKGLTDFDAPAVLPGDVEMKIEEIVLRAYQACGCRDFARVDLMMDRDNEIYVLELNSLPGMKETSLLPMSAAAVGIDFKALLKKLVEPAILRFRSKYSIC